MLSRRCFSALTPLLALSAHAPASSARTRDDVRSRYFTTSDGVRLHYLESGPRGAHVVLFVPGWTMPAWIWTPQIVAFSHRYHVFALDPRGQGESEIPLSGYEPNRRGRDIGEMIAQVAPAPVLVVGWSFGVLDTLAYVHTSGDALLAGLVLVDNSVGEDPAPVPIRPGAPLPHVVAMRRFVAGMFRRPQSADYLERLTEASLRTPETICRELLSYPVPRSYWRTAIYSTDKPVLYVVRAGFAAQAANLARKRPNTETALFTDAGHALFVDDALRFNALLASFITRRIWP